ncbi:MAG: DnaJ domain-containing protein [Deltaproteobacteria bacterium]|nr:DnaJ domain-containing protein [Deltaproteobacteria bacterium]
MLAARKNVEVRLAGQRDEAKKRAQRELEKAGGARPKTFSNEEAQREIQRRFEEQAKAWLREEQTSEPTTIDEQGPANLEESLQRELRDGLTSDLESLLTASLKPPPRPTTRPPSGAAAVRPAAAKPKPGSTGAPILLTNPRPTSKGGPIPLTNARPTSTGARPITEPSKPAVTARPTSTGAARPPSANAARPGSTSPARPTSKSPARPPDKFEFTFDSLGTAGSNVSPADVESIWDDPVGDDMGNDEEARARRARLRRLGMQNTGILPSSGGSASSSPFEPPPAPAPAPSVPPAGNTMESIKAAPPAATGDEAALGKDIEARYARIKTEDHFARLGISKNTNAQGAKAAFMELAKRFHPDKLPPSLGHLSDKTREVFAAIRESYDTLTNDQARSEYMKKLARPPTPMATKSGGARDVSGEAQLEAKKLRTMADIALKKKAFTEAEGHFAKAYEIEQHANDLAAQAWCIYLDPARKKETGIIDRLLKQAFAKDAACERAHYVSGVIARAANDMDKAEMHFRAAVKANPNNQDAALELRVIERRKQKGGETPPPTKKKGFFGL